MPATHLSQVRIKGIRTLEDVTLDLGGLTVLIGENGSGKSSILEALEILRRCTESNLCGKLRDLHNAPSAVFRRGAESVHLSVKSVLRSRSLEYSIELSKTREQVAIANERVVTDMGLTLLSRDQDEYVAGIGTNTRPIGEGETSLSHDISTPELAPLVQCLRDIEVHAPFPPTATWAVKSGRRSEGMHGFGPSMRGPQQFTPIDRLALLGSNLGSAYHALRNDFPPSHWRATLEYLKLGVGLDVLDVCVPATGEGGALVVRLSSGDVPSTALSDGELAYLCIVAAVRLAQGRRSVLALDEPDRHLHPGLIARTVSLLETAAEDTPIVVATQSDVFLNCLSDPGRQIVVCDLEMPARRTSLKRLDAEHLKTWIGRYSGVGSIRSAGYESLLHVREPDA